jgi:hypothetical protein
MIIANASAPNCGFDRAVQFHQLLHAHEIEFSDIPELSALEEVSVLAAIAGLRRAALLVNMEASQVAMLRDLAISFGLTTASLRRRFVGGGIEWPPKIAKAFREELAISSDRPALWICSNPEMRRWIREEAESIGMLLDYPRCCVEQDERDKAVVRRAFEIAIIKRAGGDPFVLRRAIREDWKVELPPAVDEQLSAEHIGRSIAAFPYVFHVACAACLADPDGSPSGRLNRKYMEFTTQLSRAISGIRELLPAAAAEGASA